MDFKTQKITSMYDEFSFGKYKGEKLIDVIEDDKQYVNWAYESDAIDIDEKIMSAFERAMDWD